MSADIPEVLGLWAPALVLELVLESALEAPYNYINQLSYLLESEFEIEI